MSQLIIERERYTDRDRLLKDRDVYILMLRGIVDNNSYLFSSAFPIDLPDYKNFKAKINNMKSQNLNFEQISKQIESLVRELSIDNKRKEVKMHSKINDNYVIPGSSIKGAIRSRIEYKFIPVNNKIKSCYRIEGDFFESQAVNHRRFWGDEVIRNRGSCNGENNEVCIVCDMFGAPSLASLVSISDAYLSNGGIERLPEFNNIEAIEPRSSFTTTIICRNFDYIRLGLLFLGLELYSNSPILLGMYKYRFNPKLGKLFRDKYAFGLVRFNLINVTNLNNKQLNARKLLDVTNRELQDKYKGYIDWNKGVI
ncbi:MAG: RAMP superfamily CRISPR-associated protein [Ignisphaera sp.]